MTRNYLLTASMIAALVCSARLSRAEQSEDLVMGMSTALSGPAADLGINMRAGVLAAFEECNRSGGIAGRQLKLKALDDGYEPSRTSPNMHQLIEQDRVLAVIGNVGTPTAVSAIPIANNNRTPFFGAFTGAGVLRRSPPDRYVINYRASYAEETAAMVDALIENAKLVPTEIAFFTQRDAYGDAGFVGGINALRRHGLTNEHLVAHGRYERNTIAVENGLADILGHDVAPKAVIMVGAYAPCAEFIKLAQESGLDAYFLNVSFVGTTPLTTALGKNGDGVIITQVVPHFESDLPIVRQYRAALKAWNKEIEPTFGSLEGYISARILIQALRSIRTGIDRESIVDALENMSTFDIGLGVKLHFDAKEHQASHSVWPTIIRDGQAAPFDWNDLKPR